MYVFKVFLMSQNSNEILYNGCVRWHHGSESVKQPCWMSDPQNRDSSCTSTTLRTETTSVEGTQPSQTWGSQGSVFLVTQMPRWCCQPQGELLGSCVWQSFLLEICSKCLPCPGHWQYSVTPGRNTHCHVPGGCACLATYQDSAQTSCGKPPALSFPVCLLHILCTHFMWYSCTVCMRLPLTRQWPLKEPQSLVYCLIFSPQHSAWHIVTLNNSGS